MSLEIIKATKRKRENEKVTPKPTCRMCGKADSTRSYRKIKIKLTKTECCDNWICDDKHTFSFSMKNIFSLDLKSCFVKHHYSRCAIHFSQKHEGRFQDCKECNVRGEGEFDFKEISCVNCSFASGAIDNFPLKTSKGYYCTKEECQEAGVTYNKNKKIHDKELVRMSLEGKTATKKKGENRKATPKPKCKSCGRGERGKLELTTTDCCGHWVCDDEHDYRQCCYREHRRYSMCFFHFNEDHQGRWQDCKECNELGGDCEFEEPEDLEEVSEHPEKKISISCVNCGFASNRIDALMETPNGYYCAKDKCYKIGCTHIKGKDIQDKKLSILSLGFKKPTKKKCVNKKKAAPKPKCRACGKADGSRSYRKRKIRVTKTECCDNWICDDEHTYVLFSFNVNSCSRNHRRYSLCANHFNEKHQGRWQDCKECQEFGGDYDFEQISCVNCDFESDAKDDFPLKTSNGYYCPKEECQKAGKHPSFSCVNCGFTADKIQDFHRVSKHYSKRYYCSKEECKKAWLNDFLGKKMTVSCVNCGFASDAIDNFPVKTSNNYYCTKEECQKAGVTDKKDKEIKDKEPS